MKRAAALALLLLSPVLAGAQQDTSPHATGSARPETSTVVVSGTTVVAYLVLAPGAVDSSADAAVVADDWSYAMATLGDSLTAHGVTLALVTEPRLRLRIAGRRDTVLVLDDEPKVGYVLARPGSAPCKRPGAIDPDEVLRAARARATCGARPR